MDFGGKPEAFGNLPADKYYPISLRRLGIYELVLCKPKMSSSESEKRAITG